jgi:hypothetical protein
MPIDQYQIEEDARTLIRAEEIKLDKKRLGRARNHIRVQAKAQEAALAGATKKG